MLETELTSPQRTGGLDESSTLALCDDDKSIDVEDILYTDRQLITEDGGDDDLEAMNTVKQIRTDAKQKQGTR